MNNIKSIDKDIIKETDSDLVNILLFGSSKYQYHINSKILSFSIDLILKTERFFGQLDNVNNAKFMNSYLIIFLFKFRLSYLFIFCSLFFLLCLVVDTGKV